jgi:NADH-quinone oxidoreductase subunit G
VHVVNPVDFDFTFELASRRVVAPSALADALADATLLEALQGMAGVAVIVGGIAENGPHAAAIRGAARALAQAAGGRLCRIPQGANALGLARHGVVPTSRDAGAMLADPRSAYLIYGVEPGLDVAAPAAALAALNAAQVVAFSHFACESTRAIADVILPIGLLPEVDGTMTNLEGRDQRAVAGGKLPGDARPGWRVLRALAGELGAPGFEFTDFAGARASIAPRAVEASAGAAARVGQGAFELASSAAIYRVDAVVRRSPALQTHPLNHEPLALMNPQDAARLGLVDGAMACLSVQDGRAVLRVVASAKVAPGTVYVEGGHAVTAPLGGGRVDVGRA